MIGMGGFERAEIEYRVHLDDLILLVKCSRVSMWSLATKGERGEEDVATVLSKTKLKRVLKSIYGGINSLILDNSQSKPLCPMVLVSATGRFGWSRIECWVHLNG